MKLPATVPVQWAAPPVERHALRAGAAPLCVSVVRADQVVPADEGWPPWAGVAAVAAVVQQHAALRPAPGLLYVEEPRSFAAWALALLCRLEGLPLHVLHPPKHPPALLRLYAACGVQAVERTKASPVRVAEAAGAYARRHGLHWLRPGFAAPAAAPAWQALARGVAALPAHTDLVIGRGPHDRGPEAVAEVFLQEGGSAADQALAAMGWGKARPGCCAHVVCVGGLEGAEEVERSLCGLLAGPWEANRWGVHPWPSSYGVREVPEVQPPFSCHEGVDLKAWAWLVHSAAWLQRTRLDDRVVFWNSASSWAGAVQRLGGMQ